MINSIKKRMFTIAAIVISLVFWLLDALVHFLAYEEPHFEFIPSDFNELWMRIVIILLIILFGITTDYLSGKILVAQNKLEATRIYNSMLYATQHIMNNLLNQMQLFKLEALKSKDFNRDIIKLYDSSLDEALSLIKKLSQIENITEGNIWASVEPGDAKDPLNKTNPTDAKNNAAD